MKTTQKKEPRTVITYNSVEEWHARAKELFGDDQTKWRFRCPVCGHVQSYQSFRDAGVSKEDAQNTFYFSCLGRFIGGDVGTGGDGKSPCDYTCGGLFQLGDFVTVVENGKPRKTCVLPFDEKG